MTRIGGIAGKAALAFGVAAAAFLAANGAWASTERVLYRFAGGNDDGAAPAGDLMRDSAGDLYGTTFSGGANGDGVVFKLSRSGTETVLYHFMGGNDGANPEGRLVMDTKGNLYGSTLNGGGSDQQGIVFKLSPRGRETVLYNFTGGSDGALPVGGVIMDANGNLYGIGARGGAAGEGVVFKLSPRGREKVLYSFTGGNDGGVPQANLVRDAGGNFYGITAQGGANNQGTVFKLTSRGREIVLHSFAGGSDGSDPRAGLLMDADGNLYGTTEAGGAANKGVVFKVSPRGRETVLYSFTGGNDGGEPFGDLIGDANGNLYGTTSVGGAANRGVVFKLSPRGRETVLHSFTGGRRDGAYPYAGLASDARGNLYGTTEEGGPAKAGVVFRVDN